MCTPGPEQPSEGSSDIIESASWAGSIAAAQSEPDTLHRTVIRSKYRGLSWDKKHQSWRVRIYFAGKQRHVGRFEDDVEAAKAYDKAAVFLYGCSAITNFDLEVAHVDASEVSSFIVTAKKQAQQEQRARSNQSRQRHHTHRLSAATAAAGTRRLDSVEPSLTPLQMQSQGCMLQQQPLLQPPQQQLQQPARTPTLLFALPSQSSAPPLLGNACWPAGGLAAPLQAVGMEAQHGSCSSAAPVIQAVQQQQQQQGFVLPEIQNQQLQLQLQLQPQQQQQQQVWLPPGAPAAGAVTAGAAAAAPLPVPFGSTGPQVAPLQQQQQHQQASTGTLLPSFVPHVNRTVSSSSSAGTVTVGGGGGGAAAAAAGGGGAAGVGGLGVGWLIAPAGPQGPKLPDAAASSCSLSACVDDSLFVGEMLQAMNLTTPRDITSAIIQQQQEQQTPVTFPGVACSNPASFLNPAGYLNPVGCLNPAPATQAAWSAPPMWDQGPTFWP